MSVPFTLKTSVPAPGHEDGDYTDEFLECGTTMSFRAEGMGADRVPVTRAYVADEVLHLEGEVSADFG